MFTLIPTVLHISTSIFPQFLIVTKQYLNTNILGPFANFYIFYEPPQK